jgi:hypothetical protein
MESRLELKNALWLKISAIILAGALVLADGLCLFKTFSRGGVLAAGLGLLYFLAHACWRSRSSWMQLLRSAKFSGTCILISLLVIMFVGVGLAGRSLEPVTTGDASVSHRLILWGAALQMAVENPLGFGTGKSGEAYMQWYQPIDSSTGYRTMVNSYLTFLVEQGWLLFALAVLAASLFWFWAHPGKSGSAGPIVATGLRASLVTFLISGIFSTTMEEPILWIIPTSCALTLLAWSLITHVSLPRTTIAWAFAVPFLIFSVLYLGGAAQSRTDPISRQFASGRTVSQLSLKQSSDHQKTWVVVPDAKILGPYYGKLFRQLVAETGVVLKVKKSADLHSPIDRLLLAGNAVQSLPTSSISATVLLAPAVISSSSVPAWLHSSPRLAVLISSIDEDRRSRFWQNSVPDPTPPQITLTTLDGIGLRVDWDWEQVIDLIRHS